MQYAHKPRSDGFSLLELLIAMVVTLTVSMIVFQLFIQNERVFRDQNLVLEMQQNARAVATMIADELRMAGQGVPVFAASFDQNITEASQAILDGSDADNLRFRAGTQNGLGVVADAAPLTYSVGTSATVMLDSSQSVFDVVGSDTDRYVYLSGPTDDLWGAIDPAWTWVRAEITDIPLSMDRLQITPTQVSGVGATFSQTPTVSLEEGISYRLDSGDILRGSAADFTSLTAPTFTEATVGENFTALQFTYFNDAGTAVNPTTLALRSTVRRVDFVVQAETAEELANGETQSYAVSLSIRPRNLEIN